MGKTTHYVLDWYANKNLKISDYKGERELKVGDKICYFIDQPRGKKQSVGTYIGTEYSGIDKEGYFSSFLEGQKLDDFEKKQAEALKKFPLFKKTFKSHFPDTIPVTAKYHIFSKQHYFYFYSDDRFQFTEFLKEFRQKLGQNFFLFQVGARDMVKMSPGTDHIVGCNGKNLCCKSNRPLPSVNVEALVAQHLEGRDIERLKGRCGKLKCSLLYEVEQYIEDNKKYRPKGTKVKNKDCEECGVVTGFNVINGMVNVKTEDGAFYELSLADLKADYERLKTQNMNTPRRK